MPRFINKHMVLSLENWRAGRWWILLTSTLTHLEPKHLYVNMLGLCNAGSQIITAFGVPTFFFLWTIGGVAGSAATLCRFALTEREDVIEEGMGISGSVGAMAAVLACAAPDLSSMILVLYFSYFSALAFKLGWFPNIGHDAHLGGFVMGALCWVFGSRAQPGSECLSVVQRVPPPSQWLIAREWGQLYKDIVSVLYLGCWW